MFVIEGSNSGWKSIIKVALLLMTHIYQIADAAAQTIDAREQTASSCPLLVRANNWEIEKVFGTWNGVEMFVHNSSSSGTFEDSCMSIRVVEVNELNEEMTYGKSFDPFNFRLALRHLKVEFTQNQNAEIFFMTFNNTNQMLWFNGSDTFMQIIKFHSTQMMLTICSKERRELYTILANRESNSDKKQQDDSISLNKLILQGRKLKVHSQFNLKSNCNVSPNSGGGQFNFSAMLLASLVLFAASVVLQ